MPRTILDSSARLLYGQDRGGDLHATLNASEKDQIPLYEALSYTWDDIKDTTNIKIGRTGIATLAITRNLYDALKDLRHQTVARTLWVDTICVNQSDLEERCRQVQRMSDIYTLARRVVVWLGPESRNSRLAMKLLRDLSSKVVIGRYAELIRPSLAAADEPHWADREIPLPWSEEEFWAIKNILS